MDGWSVCGCFIQQKAHSPLPTSAPTTPTPRTHHGVPVLLPAELLGVDLRLGPVRQQQRVVGGIGGGGGGDVAVPPGG